MGDTIGTPGAASAGEDALDLGPLPGFLGYALRRAQLAVFQDFYRTLAPLDLTPAEFSALVVVGRNPGSRQRRVGEALGIRPSNFAVLTGQLVGRALLDRQAHPTDRRSLVLRLTEAGSRLVEEAATLVRQHDRSMVAPLAKPDHVRLLDLLDAVTRGSS